MRKDFKTVLALKLKDLKTIDVWRDSNDTIVRKNAYNEAKKDMLTFLNGLINGDISQDYIDSLYNQEEK